MFIPFTTKKGFRFTPRCGWASSVPGAGQGSQTGAKMSENGATKDCQRHQKDPKRSAQELKRAKRDPEGSPKGGRDSRFGGRFAFLAQYLCQFSISLALFL